MMMEFKCVRFCNASITYTLEANVVLLYFPNRLISKTDLYHFSQRFEMRCIPQTRMLLSALNQPVACAFGTLANSISF